MEFITDNITEIILAIIALFVGITITIRIRNRKDSNTVKQKKNKVKGDMAGRDINK